MNDTTLVATVTVRVTPALTTAYATQLFEDRLRHSDGWKGDPHGVEVKSVKAKHEKSGVILLFASVVLSADSHGKAMQVIEERLHRPLANLRNSEPCETAVVQIETAKDSGR